MAYIIRIDKFIRRQIEQLPGQIKPLAKQQMADLSANPYPAKSRELAGHPGYYLIWLGAKYRLVWHVIEDERMVEIEYVGPKTPNLYAESGLGRPAQDS